MSKSWSCAAVMIVSLFSSGRALADGLHVAAEAQPPVAPPAQQTIPPPAPVAAPPTSDTTAAGKKEGKPREGVGFGGSLYLLTGSAIDNFKDGGFMVRPELELYAAIGLHDVSLLLGGTVLGVEAVDFGPRSSLAYPAMLTIAMRGDTWTAGVAGGISVGNDNSYRSHDDDESAMPSPRGEVRAGYRWQNLLELQGLVGAERQLYSNRENATRIYFGVSVGIGADSNQEK